MKSFFIKIFDLPKSFKVTYILDLPKVCKNVHLILVCLKSAKLPTILTCLKSAKYKKKIVHSIKMVNLSLKELKAVAKN